MDLFYLPEIEERDTFITFSKDESRHLTKVLRKKVGDQIAGTDGNGLEIHIELTNLAGNKVIGKITNTKLHSPSPNQLHIAIAPTKNINRFEWFLEKATEIGIHQITPILCEHSERKTIKLERLNKIIISALKQSQQFYLPKLNPIIPLASFLKENTKGMIAHCAPGNKEALFTISTNNQLILIGPEGDFSPNEIALARQQNFKEISLGNQRLRTETAGIIACHTIALKQL